MFEINKDLCVGCGICLDNCPRGAVSINQRLAVIDQSLCSQCGTCAAVCPRGAVILRSVPAVSLPELKTDVYRMKQQADELLARLERLAGSRDSS